MLYVASGLAMSLEAFECLCVVDAFLSSFEPLLSQKRDSHRFHESA
jgi:hypothetical protein